jgi:3-oxoacyl-[acyl-carrier-protein] synthase II
MAISKEGFYPPFDVSESEYASEKHPDRILVTAFGHWRGEGLGLVQSVW